MNFGSQEPSTTTESPTSTRTRHRYRTKFRTTTEQPYQERTTKTTDTVKKSTEELDVHHMAGPPYHDKVSVEDKDFESKKDHKEVVKYVLPETTTEVISNRFDRNFQFIFISRYRLVYLKGVK